MINLITLYSSLSVSLFFLKLKRKIKEITTKTAKHLEYKSVRGTIRGIKGIVRSLGIFSTAELDK